MKSVILAFVLSAASVLGMSQKPKVLVTFHAETNPNDSSTFSMPARLLYQQREARLSRVPVLSQRDLRAIYPFKTTDGSWGCVFIFNEQGRMRLDQVSTEVSGRKNALVCFISTKNGQHQVVDMLMDRPVTNGQLTVPRGISEVEVFFLKKQFKVLGEETPADKKKREKEEKEKKKKDRDDDFANENIDSSRDNRRGSDLPTPAGPPPTNPRRKAPPAPNRSDLRDLDLPRVGD